MKKNQIILISIGVLVAIGLAFGFYYWFQYSNEQQKTEIQKEIFLEPEREGGEKPNIE